jgi:ElaB/YqjD/DUF883 family membrane-anchored ribosome-binding protein
MSPQENTASVLDHTRSLATHALDRASDTATAAQRQLEQAAHASTRYVSEHPMKSALIAATIGAAVAGLVIAMRHRRNSGSYF